MFILSIRNIKSEIIVLEKTNINIFTLNVKDQNTSNEV